MVKTVIFDFDGTLADTRKAILNIVKDNQEEWGLPDINEELINDFRGKGFFELFKKYNIILLKLPFIFPKAKKELGKKIDKVPLFPGMREVLMTLRKKGIKLGILTTNSEENVKKFLRHHNLEIFDFIGSEISLMGKDKALKKVLEKRNINKNETMYIGDEIRDIEACKENGLKIISVTWGFNKKEILKKNNPDYLIDKPEEILKIVS